MNTRFVAEVSSNHARDLGRALDFVETSARIGCDAVKFQQFRIRELFAPQALRAKPELLERERWELPEAFNAELAAAARAVGIQFSSTPFYRDAVELLEPHVDFFKLASYQVLWLELLREVGASGKPVVLATGMATLEETRAAVEALRAAGTRELTLLHAISLYPTRPEQANLAAIETLRREFQCPVGWSDHSTSPAVLRRAVQRFDAALIEFHLDLEGRGEEFAAGHCWLPDEIEAAIALAAQPSIEGSTRQRLAMDGDGEKRPHPEEAIERAWRTDASDGLRPLLRTRVRLECGAA